MKICYDGLSISKLAGTGLYTYTYELISGLLEIYPQPDYHIIWDSGEKVKAWTKYSNLYYKPLDLNRVANDYSKIEDAVREDNIHIYHSTNNGFSIPDEKQCSYIMTVHDLLPLRYGDYVDKKYLAKFNYVLPKALSKCDKIITVSQHIKEDLQYFYKVAEDKIVVIYPGCSEMFLPIEKKRCKRYLKDKYGIIGDYLLFAGSIHIRKRIPILLQAFKEVRGHWKDLKLVIAGKKDGKRESYYKELKKIAEGLKLNEDVLFTGRIDYQDMPFLYNGAVCFLNLSDYEGYPLSMTEAISCGTPAICMDTPNYKEVLKERALYLERADVEELKAIILNIIYGNEEDVNNMYLNGELVSHFNLGDAVRKHVKLYESIG